MVEKLSKGRASHGVPDPYNSIVSGGYQEPTIRREPGVMTNFLIVVNGVPQFPGGSFPDTDRLFLPPSNQALAIRTEPHGTIGDEMIDVSTPVHVPKRSDDAAIGGIEEENLAAST